jgi:hypothetical protein
MYLRRQAAPTRSDSASKIGRIQGSSFSLMSPGRKPSFSPASTTGREMMILPIFPAVSACTASATAR